MSDFWHNLAADFAPQVLHAMAHPTGEKPKDRAASVLAAVTALLGHDLAPTDYYLAIQRAAVACNLFAVDQPDARKVVRAAYQEFLLSCEECPDRSTPLREAVGLRPPPLNLTFLPYNSALLQFQFSLATPYLSRDDTPFYPIDNPVRKDHVFKVPMVAATGWKGALRSAYRLHHAVTDDDETLQRLFGVAVEHDSEQGQAGSLYFFPTYFTRMSLIVINPQDREQGKGRKDGPILFEAVPAGTDGDFTLLLSAKSATQLSTDLAPAVEAVVAMLSTYGFGAKTSSGFGLAETNFAHPGSLHFKTHPASEPLSFTTLPALQAAVTAWSQFTPTGAAQ